MAESQHKQPSRVISCPQVSMCLNGGGQKRIDGESETFICTGQGWYEESDVAGTLRKGNNQGHGQAREDSGLVVQSPIGFYPTGGSHGVSAVEDGPPSLKCGSGLEIPSCPAVLIPQPQECPICDGDGWKVRVGGDTVRCECRDALPILEAGARTGKSTDDPRAGMGIGEPGDPMFTLQGSKQHAVAAYFSPRTIRNSDSAHEVGIKDGEISDCLQSDGPGAIAFRTNQTSAQGPIHSVEVTDTLSQDHPPAVAFTERGRKDGSNFESQEELAYALTNPGDGGRTNSRQVMTPKMAVRRLTPVECERLQGFPDNHTQVPYRNKPAADGPRYKALGNSMAVPVMRWIFQRIESATSQTLPSPSSPPPSAASSRA